jgi:hypothetical protein
MCRAIPSNRAGAELSSLSKSTDILVVSHSGSRSGAPMVLLRFLDWMDQHTSARTDVVLLHGGTMESSFERFDARILGGNDSRLWMLQRGLTNLKFSRAATGLALARQGPTMWANRRAPMVFMNSVGSLPAIRFMPEGAPGKVVLYVHELDTSFERTLGSAAWELLAPRVDHFIACGARVTEMLTERKGVDPNRVSEHHGFVDDPVTDLALAGRFRAELGIPPGALVVGASGQPEWRKGPSQFARFARTLRAQHPELDVYFVWLGGIVEDNEGYKLAHDIDAAGLRDRFRHVGETDRAQEVISMMDLFVITSREDPFPLVMLEAASHGVPIVSFDNGGAAEFAAAGHDDDPLAVVVGYLDVAGMAREAARLLADPVARRALARRGRDYVLANHITPVAAPKLFDTLVGLEPRLGPTVEATSAGAPRALR